MSMVSSELPSDSAHQATPRKPRRPVCAGGGRLFGRDDSLAAIRAALRGNDRLVTLTGPPGVGKTRLAEEIAEERGREDARAVAWCDLCAARDCADLLRAVGRAVSRRRGRTEAATDLDHLVPRLRRSRIRLLVLDNFEQLPADAAAAVQELLGRAPRLSALVTSRRSLGLRRERVLRIDPLALPEDEHPEAAPAVQLLLDRARCAGLDIAACPGALRALACIARELDGLPLALELAGARLGVLSPEMLLERLTDRFALLRGGFRDGPGHHATLEQALRWSWDLLDVSPQRALVQLAVFEGSFSLAAAEAILEDRPDHESVPAAEPCVSGDSLCATQLLELLLAASLLDRLPAEPDGVPQLRLLQSIRAFAHERGAHHPGAEAARDRHARWFISRLRERARQSAAVRDSVARYRADLLRAFEHALPDAPALASCALASCAIAALYEADSTILATLGGSRLTTCLDAAHRHLQGRDRTIATLLLGAALGGSRGAELFEKALALAEPADDAVLQGRIEFMLGGSLYPIDPARASRWFERARARFGAAGAAIWYGLATTRLAACERGAGRNARSLALRREALAHLREAGSPAAFAEAEERLGWILLELDEPELAIASLKRAARAHDAQGDLVREAQTRAALGFALAAAGRLDRARAAIARALQRSRELPALHARVLIAPLVAAFELCYGEPARARSHARRALEGFGDHLSFKVALCWGYVAAAEALLGDLDAAATAFAKAEAARERVAFVALDQILTALDGIRWAAAARLATSDANAARERAVQRLARAVQATVPRDGVDPVPASPIARATAALLARLLAASGQAPAASQGHPQALRLCLDAARRCATFLPDGLRLDLSRRGNLWRLLRALATARAEQPGRPIPTAVLVSRGWPGERLLLTAGRNRVRVAVAALRKLGLREVILTRDGGYLLAPGITISDSPDPPSLR